MSKHENYEKLSENTRNLEKARQPLIEKLEAIKQKHRLHFTDENVRKKRKTLQKGA